MKKQTSLLFLLVLAMFGTLAQSADMTIVSGISMAEKKRPMVLWNVTEGEKTVLATTKLDSENQFAFAINSCREGFYYLSDSLKRSFIRIWLKKGDKLYLTVKEGNDYIVNSGSAENKILAEWASLSAPIEKPVISLDTTTYRSYFPLFAALNDKAEQFKKKIVTPDAAFNRLMKYTVDFDRSLWALRFLEIPHSMHPKHEEIPGFYTSVAEENRSGDRFFLQEGDAVHYMSLYATYSMAWSKKTDMKVPREERLKQTLALYPNDTLKGIYLASTLGSYHTYEDLITYTGPYQSYIVTPVARERYFSALKANSTFKKGTSAYNFQYPDIAGNNVSLKDLKGKVVVVDMWATWCGPCKAELPPLKKLEEEFAGNDRVKFVSISVDEEKDYQKWKDFVKTQSLGGTQLYAKGWSDFAKFYGINAIPRFLVFDGEGKIVSIDAPRPSTPDLKKMIMTTLGDTFETKAPGGE